MNNYVLLNGQALPKIEHPHTDYSLEEAVQLAVDRRRLCFSSEPANFIEVRETIKEMAERAGFNWLTGAAALDVLDAAIDGIDLNKGSRLLGTPKHAVMPADFAAEYERVKRD